MTAGIQPLAPINVRQAVAAPASVVLAVVTDGAQLPRWTFFTAAEPDGDGWRVSSEHGEARLRFLDPERVGDHEVTAAPDVVVPVSVRVLPHEVGIEVVLTVVPQPKQTEAEVAEDVHVVEADLARLAALVEGRAVVSSREVGPRRLA